MFAERTKAGHHPRRRRGRVTAEDAVNSKFPLNPLSANATESQVAQVTFTI